jgi:hypothetical protein
MNIEKIDPDILRMAQAITLNECFALETNWRERTEPADIAVWQLVLLRLKAEVIRLVDEASA